VAFIAIVVALYSAHSRLKISPGIFVGRAVVAAAGFFLVVTPFFGWLAHHPGAMSGAYDDLVRIMSYLKSGRVSINPLPWPTHQTVGGIYSGTFADLPQNTQSFLYYLLDMPWHLLFTFVPVSMLILAWIYHPGFASRSKIQGLQRSYASVFLAMGLAMCVFLWTRLHADLPHLLASIPGLSFGLVFLIATPWAPGKLLRLRTGILICSLMILAIAPVWFDIWSSSEKSGESSASFLHFGHLIFTFFILQIINYWFGLKKLKVVSNG